jgi:two-component system, chemotaxis family, protein-glutamate methylesterase/glutaminase
MASSPDQQSSSAPLPWTVAIGASGSTGLSDIISVLAALSPKIDAVVLIVLHRPFDHPSKLREVLSGATTMSVIVAEQGEQFERGRCYIGEPSAHLTLAERSFGGLTNDPDAAHRGRTVDLLFQSLATYGGPRVIGVVLSGSLDDGSRGLAAIHAAGGQTMVITPDNFADPGMPENAIDYDGPIDCIGSPQQIAEAINWVTKPQRSLPRSKPKLTSQERQILREDRLKTIRLRMAIWQELDARGITTPDAIGAAIGMPVAEAHGLLTRRPSRGGDVAALEAVVARLGAQVPTPWRPRRYVAD